MSDASPIQAMTLPGRRVQGGLMSDSAGGPSRFRNSQQTVFARLQSFFPSTSSQRPSVIAPPPPLEPRVNPATPARPPPRYLKVRIVSWNMHDSLPKGNLEDLLGTVPPYEPCPENETDKLRIPDLTTEDGHPYHLVVVAGQECPTVSGIPMGLAAGFRPKEKDRTKDSDRGAKKKKGKENSKDDDLEADASSMNNPPPTPGADIQTAAGSHGATSGWSWILEEWYCNGLGHRQDGTVTSSASELYDSQAANSIASAEAHTYLHPGSITENNEPYRSEGGRKKKDGHKKRKSCCRDRKHVGPYELLVKERLMGIYMAVFIYRDLKQLIRGVSKSSVTAGLIGGLVGNKGGVGISINLDGMTLLFINAHLAAHEDRTMSRVANFNKIKTELQVNDFLPQDDPRVMSEDLTDKFDYTFLFGDLNFRLDITRLHADWLIARQDYDQALTFDQLRPLMRDGEAFMRYNEAPIRFPPTFKYNVMKSAKRDKPVPSKELGRARSSKRWHGQRSNQNLSEVQGAEAEISSQLANEERGGSLDAEDDNASFASTTVMSMLSQGGSGEPGDSDALFPRPNTRLSNQTKGGDAITKDNGAARKLFVAKAALKAKAKWMAMVRPKAPNQPIGRKFSKASQHSSFSASFPQLKTRAATSDSESTPPAFRAASSAIELGRPSAHSTGELRRISSRRSVKSTRSTKGDPSSKGTENSRQEAGPGVYDTSSKQRVPSWCDRILWKSTVEPEPDSDEEAVPDQRNGRLGPRMLAFLTYALRPLTPRPRTMSLSSLPSLSTAEAEPPTSEKEALHPGTARSDSQPLMRQASAGSEKDLGFINVRTLANIVSMRNFPNRKPRKAKMLKSMSIDPPSPTRVPASSHKRRSRAYSAVPHISAPVVPLPDDTAYITEVNDPEPSPPMLFSDNAARQRTSSTRGWLRLPFFNREPEVDRLAATLSYGAPQSQEAPASRPHRPRRGEVAPLSYRSLDDQAMQRLEGRSDHRPVIGSYIIYV